MQEKLVETASKGESCCPDLDSKTRLIGFIITFIIGLVLSLSSIGTVLGLFGNIFGESGASWSAGLLTFGNICCVASTFFLYGPKQQCKKMLEPIRAITSIILIGMFIFSFIAAFVIQIQWITCLAVVIQFGVLVWYVFSYIPFAQECLSKCSTQVCCGCCMKKEVPLTEGS